MKTPLRNAILVLMVLLVGFNQPGNAQTPDAAQLLRDVQGRYASLQSYSATGEVVSGVTRDSSASIFPSGQSQEMHSTFTIKLARPQMYRIVWEQGNSFFASKGAVWSDGESRYVTMGGQIMHGGGHGNSDCDGNRGFGWCGEHDSFHFFRFGRQRN